LPIILTVARDRLKRIGARERCPQFLKQAGLAEFARKIEADIIVGKNMGAMPAAHPVEGFSASLWEDDGPGLANSSTIFSIRQSASAQDILVGHDVGMK